ncbi:ISNCY family transposase [Microvirga splendida]|uniref:ISNCY family transposase n=1 Tax=Microvirga splendida TaxID=2795727 RepID=A0ABS0Y6L4_9HYPH|nr:ISNCY family transposase [Microvirga splendida]MBJ6127518.1 ISNCY family transposase [Microvirga splendida]
MAVVSMSNKEFSRLNVLMDLEARRITVRDACALLQLKRRQVFRLLKAFREHGAVSLASKRRGRPGNNRLPASVRDLVVTIIKERYPDFGPTLATEKLRETHGCPMSRETVRKWMMEEGLWLDRRRRLPSVHQPRNRRERMGELIQIDGSKHWWFEARGPQCTLLAYIDDATSRLMHAAFVPSESTFDCLRETRQYVAVHGRPIAFYSDKHAIFRVSRTEAEGGDGMTQFGRALHELNIDILCANTPAAKGRIERSFGTLQDRLVKEMRLAGISTIEAANAFLPGFLADHNRRFAKEPFSRTDAHRPVPQEMVLEDVFAWKEERTVTHNLTLQYNKVMFILEPNEITRLLAHQRVTVYDYPDGRFAIKHKGISLPYRIYDKLRQVDQAAIVENKRLGPILAYVAERQKELDMKRSQKAPRRQGQGKSIFKVG